MWSKVNDSDYFIKFVKEENWKEIIVSNFIEIFIIRLSDEQFLQKIKDVNRQLLEIDDFTLLQNVEQMLQNPASGNEMDISLLPNNTLSISIKRSRSFGFPLRLELSLSKGSEKNFFSHVTAPLLRVIHDLKNSQNELCKLLVQKDKEIDDYRKEGAKLYYEHIKRLNALLRAPVFNYEKFKSQDTLLVKLFKDDEILKYVLNKVIDLEAHISVKEKLESKQVKQELDSATENLNNDGGQSGIEPAGNANEIHCTSMFNVQNIKKELKETARRPLKREPVDPISSDTSSVITKEENIPIRSCSRIINKKPKKFLNL